MCSARRFINAAACLLVRLGFVNEVSRDRQAGSPRAKTATLRNTVASTVVSVPVAVFIVLIAALIPIAVVLRDSQAQQTAGSTMENIYAVASYLPVVGIIFTALAFVAYLWRKLRPAVKVDKKQVKVRGGATFLTSQLARVQVYTRADEGTYLVLIPQHAADKQVTALMDEAAMYTAAMPDKPNHQAFEFVELIKAHRPDVAVDKWGSV